MITNYFSNSLTFLLFSPPRWILIKMVRASHNSLNSSFNRLWERMRAAVPPLLFYQLQKKSLELTILPPSLSLPLKHPQHPASHCLPMTLKTCLLYTLQQTPTSPVITQGTPSSLELPTPLGSLLQWSLYIKPPPSTPTEQHQLRLSQCYQVALGVRGEWQGQCSYNFIHKCITINEPKFTHHLRK